MNQVGKWCKTILFCGIRCSFNGICVQSSKAQVTGRLAARLGRITGVRLVNDASQKSGFPVFPPPPCPSFNTLNSLLFCQNTPKYPHLYWRAPNGIPGHDLLSNRLKQVPDENKLMSGGSDSGLLMAYFGNPGCFQAFLLEDEIGAFYGFFRGGFCETGADPGLDLE